MNAVLTVQIVGSARVVVNVNAAALNSVIAVKAKNNLSLVGGFDRLDVLV